MSTKSYWINPSTLSERGYDARGRGGTCRCDDAKELGRDKTGVDREKPSTVRRGATGGALADVVEETVGAACA